MKTLTACFLIALSGCGRDETVAMSGYTLKFSMARNGVAISPQLTAHYDSHAACLQAVERLKFSAVQQNATLFWECRKVRSA